MAFPRNRCCIPHLAVAFGHGCTRTGECHVEGMDWLLQFGVRHSLRSNMAINSLFISCWDLGCDRRFVVVERLAAFYALGASGSIPARDAHMGFHTIDFPPSTFMSYTGRWRHCRDLHWCVPRILAVWVTPPLVHSRRHFRHLIRVDHGCHGPRVHGTMVQLRTWCAECLDRMVATLHDGAPNLERDYPIHISDIVVDSRGCKSI